MPTEMSPVNTGGTWPPEAEIVGPPMEAEAVPVNSGATCDADAETLGAPIPRDEVPRASTGIPEIGVSESARKPSIVWCYPLLLGVGVLAANAASSCSCVGRGSVGWSQAAI